MTSRARVVLLSFWRRDSARGIDARVAHLLAKDHRPLRWLWVVSVTDDDGTWPALIEHVKRHRGLDISVVAQHDEITRTPDHANRLLHLGAAANAGLANIRADDDVVCIHESDLLSSADVIGRLLALGDIGAGWPLLHLHGRYLFYDTWAYRRDGERFSNVPPYHACYRPDRPFDVDSCGSVWAFPAAAARAGMRCRELACLDLCAWLRAAGHRIRVDPRIEIVQPDVLWGDT